MNEKLHIGLIAKGGRNWVGGLELTKNIAAAVTKYCSLAERPVKITVFGDSINSTGLVDFPSDSRILFHKLPPAPSQSTARKIGARLPLINRLLTKEHRLLKRELRNQGVNFAYPMAERSNPAFRSAMWIPDFQHCHLPKFFSDHECHERSKTFERWAGSTNRLVFSSASAQDDFRSFFPHLDVNSTVLHFRVAIPSTIFKSSPKQVREHYNLPSRYFLVCGQLWAHKNHQLVLEALSQLKDRHPDIQVVMTGRLSDHRNESHVDDFLSSIQILDLSQNVRLLGLVPKHDQLNLLRASLAVIQPSLFEGWSTVLEESHALGKRILASEIPPHLEQNPPNSVFFQANDASELALIMENIWRTPECAPQDEKHALKSYEKLVLQFGKEFCDMAESE